MPSAHQMKIVIIDNTRSAIARVHGTPEVPMKIRLPSDPLAKIADVKVSMRVPAFDPGLESDVREAFQEPNWAQWIKLNLE